MRDGLLRHVMHGEAERQVQEQQRVDDAVAKAEIAGKAAARIERVGIEERCREHRHHPFINRHFPWVLIDLADFEIFELAPILRLDYTRRLFLSAHTVPLLQIKRSSRAITSSMRASA